MKKKKENIEYIVRVNLKELGIDETSFDELQELFRMFDNDKDGVLSLKEFEKILSVLGRSGMVFVIKQLIIGRTIYSNGGQCQESCQRHIR